MKFLMILGLMGIAVVPCIASHASPHVAGQPSVRWTRGYPSEVDGKSLATFTVTGLDSIERLCFHQIARPLKAVSRGDSLVEINAGYYYITSPLFGTDAEMAEIKVDCGWDIYATAERPEAFHAVTPGGRVIPVRAEVENATDASLGPDPRWRKWTLPADSIYVLNERLSRGKKPGAFDIVPSFKSVTPGKGYFTAGSPVETAIISHENPEYYRISIKPGKALVEGASEKAVKMGKRMLEKKLPDAEGKIPCGVIEDWPDYPYRALMIDIARNFMTPAQMRKIVDAMADYRLNTLHFHITDDEAWRLEIPGLPELTEVGSRRGYTTDSRDFLPSIFSGDGNPDSKEGMANGYFTRDDFISFIRYCDSLGIRVIPEIESPGHARAAIKAMEARFRNTGDSRYRLIEPGDTSSYTSAQLYHDNLMNPALPSVYAFMAKVIDEVEAMYHEAGVTLEGVHIGGDEVPEGAWDGSPAAMDMAREKAISGRHALQGEFVRKMARIMRDRSIPLYGWQDICTDYDEAFHTEVAPIVGGMNCWVSSADPDKNIAIKGVKSGYPVILSNVNYFYMDMLYGPLPDERGLYWGGYVDELQALSGYPDKLCPPQEKPKGKIIGVSGQLFGETLRSAEGAETLLFPKAAGLAERGWNGNPTYSEADFNMLIGEKELTRLRGKGIAAHLRWPGIKVENGMVMMNSPYPDAEIRYTLDGSEPTVSSALYTGAFKLPAGTEQVRAILLKDGFRSVQVAKPID